MELSQALSRVAVLGAAGKMGSGIALLLLQEMARIEADEYGQVGKNNRRLILIDSNEEALRNLRHYLQQHLIRYAEKNINLLRRYYATDLALVSNEEVIGAFVQGAFDLILLETKVSAAKDATCIFEAIIEDLEVKAAAFKKIKSDTKQFFFTNTSSIPIHVLRKKSDLNDNLVGLHFYNPPSVLKLIELIAPKDTKPEAKQLALDLASRLNKVIVESADVAGFIGNGHFMREVIFACRQVHELSKQLPKEEAIFLINRITGDYLVRPMGIFQLIDFVGVHVVQQILSIMQHYLHDQHFHDDLIDQMVKADAVGGITPEGTMQDGFFQYGKNKPMGVYVLEKNKYRPFGPWSDDIKRALGPLPKNYNSWKALVTDPDKQPKIESYFERLFESGTAGSEVTIDYLMKSREILDELVRDGVAKNRDDVNTVLITGFYHLYGADIPWFDFAHVFRSNICDV